MSKATIRSPESFSSLLYKAKGFDSALLCDIVGYTLII
jgi:hypothetical protein